MVHFVMLLSAGLQQNVLNRFQQNVDGAQNRSHSLLQIWIKGQILTISNIAFFDICVFLVKNIQGILDFEAWI